MTSIYYYPEKSGLKIIAQIDDEVDCYSFDLTVVWQDIETGKKYWAQDSGCSCPSPFETFSRNGLRPLETDADWTALVNHLMAYTNDDHWSKYSLAAVNLFMKDAKS